MYIGSLRRRVTLLKYIEEKDEYGAATGSWKATERLWASVEPQGGSENYDNGQVKAVNTMQITIRYNPRVNEIDRIGYGDKLYGIDSVSDKGGLHKTTLLSCREVKKDGG